MRLIFADRPVLISRISSIRVLFGNQSPRKMRELMVKAMTQRPTLGGTFFACALLSFAFTISAPAQSARWKKYVSEKGKFSVLMPGVPTTDYREGDACSDREMVYKTIYRTDTNYRDPNWTKYEREWSVDYFDLPPIPPDAKTIYKVFDQATKVYHSRPMNKKSMILNGYPAIEFKLKAVDERDRADRNRDTIVRVILVNQRVYELRVTTQPHRTASSDVTKFFRSFKPAPLTEEEVVAAARAVRENHNLRKFVDSDTLERQAIKKVQPAYPPKAKAAGVSGEVSIAVLISEEGTVIRAEAVLGPALLYESALAAARLWVFRPIECSGKPVKAYGNLDFKFARQ